VKRDVKSGELMRFSTIALLFFVVFLRLFVQVAEK
jgi:hypothetical protein